MVGGSLAGIFAVAVYPAWRYIFPGRIGPEPREAELPGMADLLKPGTGELFPFGSKPGLILKKPNGEIKAFSAICTHFDCTVMVRPEEGDIFCACHDGFYDFDGNVTGGPPPRPLDEFVVVQKGSDIIVYRTPEDVPAEVTPAGTPTGGEEIDQG
jgi:Rieske Fe-S protein